MNHITSWPEPTARQLCEMAGGSEPLIAITPTESVPQSRFLEWLRGSRPLPGQDEKFFFQAQEDIVGIQRAQELRVRHLQMSYREHLALRIYKGELAFEQADQLYERNAIGAIDSMRQDVST